MPGCRLGWNGFDRTAMTICVNRNRLTFCDEARISPKGTRSLATGNTHFMSQQEIGQRKVWSKPKIEDMAPLADTSATVPPPPPTESPA